MLLSLAAPDLKDWVVAYDGHGLVSFQKDGLRIQPASARDKDETHAALVLSRHIKNLKYFELTITYTNLSSLRTDSPRPWEAFWFFFNYRPDHQFKKTNYLLLKTNGLEIGRASGKNDQVILMTTDRPVMSYGKSQTLRLRRMGTLLWIQVDSQTPVVYDFSHATEQPYSDPGAIGLYSEDAAVLIEKISLSSI